MVGPLKGDLFRGIRLPNAAPTTLALLLNYGIP